MLKYATEVAHVKAPKLHYVYAQENARLMVTDFVPGVPLDTVWQSLDDANRASIRKDLQEQIRRMRISTKCSISRVNIDGGLDVKATFPDPCHPIILVDTSSMAFANEHDFDTHKIDEARKRNVAAATDMQKRIQQRLKTYTQKFVLTHGDPYSRKHPCEARRGHFHAEDGLADFRYSRLGEKCRLLSIWNMLLQG
jgi:hypothetical protein